MTIEMGGGSNMKKEGLWQRLHGEQSHKQLIVGTIFFGGAIILCHLFALSVKVEFTLFFTTYLILGHKVLLKALKNSVKGQMFDENFLMSTATLGAFALGDFPEAAGVMLFYLIGESFQSVAVHKSKKSIAQLMGIRPDYANIKKGTELVKVAPETLAVGDSIVVKLGEKFLLTAWC
jgi:Cd2+/Zn2+-exporting ATPase